MSKIRNLKLRKTLIFFTSGVFLTGCTKTYTFNPEKNYETNKLSVIYAEGRPYIVDKGKESKTFQNISFCDVLTGEEIAEYNAFFESTKASQTYHFNNDEKGGKVVPYAINYLDDVIDEQTISGEKILYFSKNLDELSEMVDEFYDYSLLDTVEYEKDQYEINLSLYKIVNIIEKTESYHIGYKANRINPCSYIYDIIDHCYYKIPDGDNHEIIKLSTLYQGDTITANKAKLILENYLNQKVYIKK